MELERAKKYIQEKLGYSLSPTLYYHGLHHTLDVVAATLRIAQAEGLTDEYALILLETAAWYHDVGFIVAYKGHEEESCRIATVALPRFGYSIADIDVICGMIRATKIPQEPQNLLEKIIADADLDYLGRGDFEPIAATLYDELREREMVIDKNSWDKIQVSFLENHHFHTQTAQQTRNDFKKINLEKIRGRL